MTDHKLSSFIFVVRPHTPYTIVGHMGRAIQQCFLTLLDPFNPGLAAQLHDGTTGARPYTVTGLFRLGKTQAVHGPIAADERVWFRISALTNGVSDALQTIAATQTGASVEIDHFRWTLETIDASSGLWAQQSTYQMLIAEHAAARPRSELRLTFDTPTGFHTKGSTVPFPLPALLFESLIMRWNAFSPVLLPELLHPFVDQHVSIHAFEGTARSILQKNGHSEVGFIGDMTYTMIRRNPTLHKVDPMLSRQLEVQYTPLAQAVNMLADFALFSGAGIKTASGMGLMRRIR